jgi:N4-(beta-N-acetylglucosaminyl)-L-asparaginase
MSNQPALTPTRVPVLVGSWNARPAVARSVVDLAAGTALLDAIVQGIQLVEDDPEEMSVGFGGLPNEDGIVELDAAVMDGVRHRSGAVACVRGFRHVARLAVEVMRRTDHSLLVGDGAMKFARALGFPEENLLTPRAREAWLAWKANLSDRDAWIGEIDRRSDFGKARWAGLHDPKDAVKEAGAPPASVAGAAVSGTDTPGPGVSAGAPKVPFTFGTIHVSGVDASGNLACVTSTSGLSYKIAGRVGDSAVVGAGLYCDNDIGSAGSTGRGEAVLQNCGAYAVVQHMAAGKTPEEACMHVLRTIASHTREPRLIDDFGRPTFNVTMYALRKDGMAGAASMLPGYEYVVQRGNETKTLRAPSVFDA